MFQICPVCDMQQDIEPYDFCQTCGHEWSSAEIRSSTPVPIERGFQQNAHLTGGGLCAECGSPAWTHSVRDHAFVEPHHPQVA